ncbi:MAG: hypothetical protein Q8942_18795 [Bacillota bacterium]|nr:hypothetical protein [Bacillota bacterium]
MKKILAIAEKVFNLPKKSVNIPPLDSIGDIYNLPDKSQQKEAINESKITIY